MRVINFLSFNIPANNFIIKLILDTPLNSFEKNELLTFCKSQGFILKSSSNNKYIQISDI